MVRFRFRYTAAPVKASGARPAGETVCHFCGSFGAPTPSVRSLTEMAAACCGVATPVSTVGVFAVPNASVSTTSIPAASNVPAIPAVTGASDRAISMVPLIDTCAGPRLNDQSKSTWPAKWNSPVSGTAVTEAALIVIAVGSPLRTASDGTASAVEVSEPAASTRSSVSPSSSVPCRVHGTSPPGLVALTAMSLRPA